MKAKGRRISHNVERAPSFGSKVDPKHKYNPDMRTAKPFSDWSKIVEDDIRKTAGSPPTKQQKVNEVANRLNEIGRQSKTPIPSPRGKQPIRPAGKPPKKTTAYPGTHTTNKTFDTMKSGMNKSVIRPRVDKIAEEIKNARRLEELREIGRKRSDKQSRPKPKYDKKTGKKL